MKLTNITFTATDSQFKVIVDGAEVSRHNTDHKALERLVVEKIKNPDAEVLFTRNQKVIANATFEESVAKSKTISFTTGEKQ